MPLDLAGVDLHSVQSTRRLSGRTMSLSPGVTMLLATALWTFLRALLFGSAAIALENLALRHQLVVLQRAVARPRLTRWDRILWVWLSRLWASWRSSLVIVQPATVLAWHRQGFQLYWRWKSRANPVGRPRLDPELRRSSGAGSREPHLGPPPHPRRTRPPRLPRRRTHRREVHVPDVAAALPDVAGLSGGSPPRDGRRRLLCRPHPHLSSPLRLRRPPT